VNFLIADTFTDSLSRLAADEQKAAKMTAFDMQVNPSAPGLAFHRLEKARDKGFWSVRVSGDLRIIVHKTAASLLLCYVDHHDAAYRWAERRKLETHPTTGAAQLVEIRETVQEIAIPRYVEVERPKAAPPPLFAQVLQEDLLGYGVPKEWLEDVRHATEDTLLELVEHLPSEAAEALLDLATGKKPQVPAVVAAGANPFDHPDAQRRFRVMGDLAELERALEYPWEKWTIFLHPSQRQLVERDYSGPARVSGTAGTGKTIVALHRAVYLARRYPEARVLLTTLSETLANALRTKLRRLIGNEPRLAERLEVHSMNEIGLRLHAATLGRPRLAKREELALAVRTAASAVEGHKFSHRFLLNEWDDVVDAWQLRTWEQYRDVARLGRKTRLSEKNRALLWEIFERVQRDLAKQGLVTLAGLFTELAEHLTKAARPVFDFAVIDEAQDVGIAQLRFLAALGGSRPNGLFFSGDLGQRIFQQPFSWKAVGVDIRGRSKTLRINYRTSHQIRQSADLLLAPELTDVDGNAEERRGAISVFNGPPPTLQTFDSEEEEIDSVAGWLKERKAEGYIANEIGVFVRSDGEMDRARRALEAAGLPFRTLDDRVETVVGHASLGTMHLAKGLEFRAVVVMACDDDIIPNKARLAGVTEDSDLQDVYETERHLLYVACTRARDRLLVTGREPASEFLDDLHG